MDSLATCSCSGQNTHPRTLPVLPESCYERRIGHVDARALAGRLIASPSIKSTFWSKKSHTVRKTPFSRRVDRKHYPKGHARGKRGLLELDKDDFGGGTDAQGRACFHWLLGSERLLLVDRNMRAAENAHFSFSVITPLRSVPQERRTATRVYPSCTKIEQEQGKDHCLSVISDRSRSLYSGL